MSASVFGPSEKQRLSSWWPKQGNNAAGQEYSGTPIPHIQTLQRATRIRSRRAIGEEFLKKTTWPVSDTWQVRTRVRRCYVTRLFSVKIPATDSGISDVGLEARVARMRGRIRGAERWNLAGRDDVHRNPDRSSRPAVLLYSSCSWLR